MKPGDIVRVKDTSWARVFGSTVRLPYFDLRGIDWRVMATGQKLPPLRSDLDGVGQRYSTHNCNDVLLATEDAEEPLVAFVESRFCVPLEPPKPTKVYGDFGRDNGHLSSWLNRLASEDSVQPGTVNSGTRGFCVENRGENCWKFWLHDERATSWYKSQSAYKPLSSLHDIREFFGKQPPEVKAPLEVSSPRNVFIDLLGDAEIASWLKEEAEAAGIMEGNYGGSKGDSVFVVEGHVDKLLYWTLNEASRKWYMESTQFRQLDSIDDINAFFAVLKQQSVPDVPTVKVKVRSGDLTIILGQDILSQIDQARNTKQTPA